jgi:hypothetical protein
MVPDWESREPRISTYNAALGFYVESVKSLANLSWQGPKNPPCSFKSTPYTLLIQKRPQLLLIELELVSHNFFNV